MQQQRARMMKRRARLKKKKADMKKYGSGGKPAVTRDTSKNAARIPLVYTSENRARIKAGNKKPADSAKTQPAAKKPAPKPASVKPAKPAANSTKAASNFYRSSSGTRGQLRPSNPPSPTVTAKTKAGSRAKRKKEDPRETGRKRNLREAQAAKARRERKEQFTKKPYGGMASSPPKNPKEGDVYKKPFGPVMIYKNGKFVRA